ncbi:hypothetical protein [Candidatus Odyssella thessalonicensis]|uniref:hypothetical protein n=1 Tax=Candidatus Odyssella thessalonicensis TaxID=84647 RepID=UPI000225A9E3|nr:hypothetical protein [Candidatus Odyssella thessalonicensis]
MKYNSLIVKLAFFGMNLNMVVGCDNIGSQLIGPEENKEIVRRVMEKAGPNADVRFLTEEEKEWLYETDILESIKISESHGESEAEDRSRDLSELARFYEYKGRSDLVNKTLYQKAQVDLMSALNGNEAMLKIFRGMLIDKRLNDNFFREIIELAEKDTRNYVNGKYAGIIDKDQFQMHARSLAEAYKDSPKETLNIRKMNNVPPIRFDDEDLTDILMERIKKVNNIQG